MSAAPEPQRRILVAVDVERYSQRGNLAQLEIQRVLQWVLGAAADRLGLRRERWRTQASGDGELAVLPAGTSETRVVGRLGTAVDELLRERNRGRAEDEWVRVQVALHVGLVHLDGANGFPGTAPVTVSRLLDAAPLKRALRAFPAAGAAIIVSEPVFDDIVAHGYEGLRPDDYTKVRIELPDKHFDQGAYLTIPGVGAADVAALVAPAPARPTPPAQTAPGGGFVFNNLTTYGPAAFGPGASAQELG